MKNSNQIDLRTQGGSRAATVTPGNSVQYVFDAQQSRIGASGTKPGLYNNVAGIWIDALITVVRATATGVLYADQFARCISSIGLTTPMHGTLIDPSVVDGQVAKHMLECPGMAYRYAGINRDPIPAADGTYTRHLEIFIPFKQFTNQWPDHFNWWLGWLDESILEIFVSNAALPFGLAGTTVTSVVFNAALETVPCSEIIIPPYIQIRRYEQAAAAGSNGPKLTNVGDAGALQGADDGCRLMAMYFAHQVGGFTGSGTADQISALSMPWRDQAQSTLPQFFFGRFLESAHRHKAGTLAALDNVDQSTPYIMPTGVPATAQLNAATAMYTPLVWEQTDELISTYQKIKGNVPLDGMIFSATQTGSFRVYTRELKQFSVNKCSEMLAAAGIDPSKVQLAPKLGYKNIKPVMPDKVFGFPRSVIAKK